MCMYVHMCICVCVVQSLSRVPLSVCTCNVLISCYYGKHPMHTKMMKTEKMELEKKRIKRKYLLCNVGASLPPALFAWSFFNVVFRLATWLEVTSPTWIMKYLILEYTKNSIKESLVTFPRNCFI